MTDEPTEDGGAPSGSAATEPEVDALSAFRQFFALERDVVVLSLAMFAFSLGFQMTGRYMGEYLAVLGAGSLAIGAYASFGELLGAVYPYPGGVVSDRIGSRTALTAFGLLSAGGFALWVLAPTLGGVLPAVPAWAWVFVGLLAVQAWKSFGIGATFAVVRQSVPDARLATGFASTETFRRVAFLVGPLLAAGVLAAWEFEVGFRYVLAIAALFAVVGTVAQHLLYDPGGDTVGDGFGGLSEVLAGLSRVVDDLRGMPDEMPPLLAGDTLVRFGNGMVHVFVVVAVVDAGVDATVLGFYLNPGALFGVLLAVEMAVALLTMVPVARLAEHVGLKPVVALGFAVYALFPALLISALQVPVPGMPTPANAAVVAALFAFSGLRFAGLPAHKALIVGPAEAGGGGRAAGTYYLVRNGLRIPAGVVGGALYALDPVVAFGAATAVGLAGTAVFLAFGKEFEAYAR